MTKPFEYLRPSTSEEAIALKAKYKDRARYWAGGTDLMLQWRAGEVDIDYCIDLTFVPTLNYIENERDGVRIGAMTSLDALDNAASLNQLMKVIGYTARLMCTKQTRTISTVGGNMCNASPGADLSPLFVALDSEATIMGSDGSRTVLMENFFQGVNETILKDEELLVEIRVPVPDHPREACYKRVARTFVDIALISSAVSISSDNGVVTDARISLGSVAPVPIRSRAAEQKLIGSILSEIDDDILEEIGQLAATDASPISDIRAGKEYRLDMCTVLTRRSLEESVRNLIRKQI
jgi:carbon-monoxide dehydrogenase medium subunit